MKIRKIGIIFLVILLFALVFLPTINISLADDTGINPGDFKPTNSVDGGKLFTIGQRIVNILRAISIMVAIISLSILGVKYMVGSVEEKASYKEKLIPITIGAVLIAGLATFLEMIRAVVS